MESEESQRVYHEKQRWQFCLIHTVNNILQRKEFTPETMDEICYALNESKWFNPHKSWIGLGNYDANILMAALQQHNFKVVWFDKRNKPSTINFDLLRAVVVNIPSRLFIPFVRNRHWYPLVNFNNKFFNLDSKISSPEKIENVEEYMDNVLRSSDAEVLLVVPMNVAEAELFKSSE
ncbi:unnamed protein product [Caenorhabditis bovis]|uniref:ubiquitinyl hydrolase 1 n=1 Tax=Caenorhabditis bovis TaxID=2654633 RepID=A0A8S1ELZ6_9PELO|nr:unnamed protein product [Caenorhabditis bovis]